MSGSVRSWTGQCGVPVPGGGTWGHGSVVSTVVLLLDVGLDVPEGTFQP